MLASAVISLIVGLKIVAVIAIGAALAIEVIYDILRTFFPQSVTRVGDEVGHCATCGGKI